MRGQSLIFSVPIYKKKKILTDKVEKCDLKWKSMMAPFYDYKRLFDIFIFCVDILMKNSIKTTETS